MRVGGRFILSGIWGGGVTTDNQYRQPSSASGSGVTTSNQYGQPSGSFYARGAFAKCPPGYVSVPQYRGAGDPTTPATLCIPRPQPTYRPPLPPPAPITVTVTPSFQQSFTPQFSPTMQQQQDSPAATQSAEPVQVIEQEQVSAPSPTPIISTDIPGFTASTAIPAEFISPVVYGGGGGGYLAPQNVAVDTLPIAAPGETEIPWLMIGIIGVGIILVMGNTEKK